MFSSSEESIIQAALKSADVGDGKRAIDIIDVKLGRLTNVREQADAILRKAVIYGVMGQFDDARRELREAKACVPNDPDVLLQADFVSAALFDQEGKPEEAFQKLTDVAEKYRERWQEPELREMYQDLQVRRGLDAVTIRRFQEAADILRECLTFNLEDDDRSKILSNIGISCSELGDYRVARDYLLNAVTLGLVKELEGLVHLHLGISLARLKQFREAKSEFQKCEQNAPEYGFGLSQIYGWLSWVCERLGELSESREYARLARLT